MKEQKWYCEKCNTSGSITYSEEDEDWVDRTVFNIVYAIEDSHKNASPECTNPVRELRLIMECSF